MTVLAKLEIMFSTGAIVDNFRWYDWAAIIIMSDISATLLFALLSGAIGVIMILPLLVIAWLSYENFRGSQYDKESD
jgi:hypothetical protein